MTEINLEFYKAAHLDIDKQRLYSEKRQPGERFAIVIIADCQSKDWWYAPFIGMEVFVMLRFMKYAGGEFVREAVCVHLYNSRITIGRTIDAKDIIIK